MIAPGRDSVWVGLLVALLLPAATWLGLTELADSASGRTVFGAPFSGFSDSFIATMSVCANFFPFFVYMRTRKDDAMRGVGLATMLLALVVAVLFFF